MNEIETDKPRHYPFMPKRVAGEELQLRRNGYLSKVTSRLHKSFVLLFSAKQAKREPINLAEIGRSDQGKAFDYYIEGSRILREAWFFSRNPLLTRAAKRRGKLICEACSFNFGATYGILGYDYIECHHKNPLSERNPWLVSTKLEEIALLCANCHRMAHRRRPALSIVELKQIIEKNRLLTRD